MDGMQTYSGSQGASAPASSFSPATFHLASSGVAKTPADYLRAVRRQLWLVLSIALLVSVVGSLVVLRMKAVYRTEAEITIKPPEYDAILSQLVARENVLRVDKDAQALYVPDRLAFLRSKSLVEKVVRDPSVSGPRGPDSVDDASSELIENLTSRNYTGTSFFKISLEGSDPAKITRMLRLLLDKFKRQSEDESKDLFQQSKLQASSSLVQFSQDLKKIDHDIYELLRGSLAIAPGGKSILQDRYDSLAAATIQKKVRFEDLQRQLQIEARHPQEHETSSSLAKKAQLAKLAEDERMLQNRVSHARRTIKATYFNSDPHVQILIAQMHEIQLRKAELLNVQDDLETPPDSSDLILASARQEIDQYEAESRSLLTKLQESVPEHDRYLTLRKERDEKASQIGEIQRKLSQFEVLDRTQKPPVTITVAASEPISPVRPKRSISIALCVAFGLILGVATACFREYLDHSVKVPEHLTAGLSMPLLGVVPRMRRTFRNHRGGHLWTPGAPESVAADAYRNLRASLVGIARSQGAFITLLVTSAKAGEGKSTTALNLAATCARAGERTLLVDIDLRRPSLGDVFPHPDNHLGLVDVLRGELPWQRTVVKTELPNLDFLPTGDTRNIPIEILGSLELRQLLLSLSTNHYDRVILDGPAVLGLADCRMLGEIVDAAILVVRCGSVELRPLRRAKAMLEQSHVRLAGLVFNGLADDLDNWSSYGPGLESTPGIGQGPTARRLETTTPDGVATLAGRE